MSTTQVFGNGSAIYNNGKIAISKDLIFGLTAWDGNGWVPLKELNKEDQYMVLDLIDGDPSFLWKKELGEALDKIG